MKRVITTLIVLGSLSLPVFSPVAAAQKKMPALTFSVIFDLDGTIRCLGSGSTTVPSSPIEGDVITISLDNDGTEAFIQMSNDSNAKPTTIDSTTAHWKLGPGQELVLTKQAGVADNAKWDVRHFSLSALDA